MQRLLLTALLFVAACGPSFSKIPTSTRRTGDTEELVCNEEVFSPRGTATTICRTRSQIEGEKRFAKDLKLDSHPRPTYN